MSNQKDFQKNFLIFWLLVPVFVGGLAVLLLFIFSEFGNFVLANKLILIILLVLVVTLTIISSKVILKYGRLLGYKWISYARLTRMYFYVFLLLVILIFLFLFS